MASEMPNNVNAGHERVPSQTNQFSIHRSTTSVHLEKKDEFRSKKKDLTAEVCVFFNTWWNKPFFHLPGERY